MVAPGQTFMIQRMGAEEGPFTLADLQAQVRAKYIRVDVDGPPGRRRRGVVPRIRDPRSLLDSGAS